MKVKKNTLQRMPPTKNTRKSWAATNLLEKTGKIDCLVFERRLSIKMTRNT